MTTGLVSARTELAALPICRGCIFRCVDCGSNDHANGELPPLESPYERGK